MRTIETTAKAPTPRSRGAAWLAILVGALSACMAPVDDDPIGLALTDLHSGDHLPATEHGSAAGTSHGDATDQVPRLAAFPTDDPGEPPPRSRYLRRITLVAEDTSPPAGIQALLRIYAHYDGSPSLDVTPWAEISTSNPAIAHPGNLQLPFRTLLTPQQGSVTVTASFQGHVDSESISVGAPLRVGLVIDGGLTCSTEIGETSCYPFRVLRSNGTTVAAGDGVGTIADPAVASATVQGSELCILGLAEGTTTATLSADDLVLTVDIEVTTPPPFTVEWVKEPLVAAQPLEVGETVPIFASVVANLPTATIPEVRIELSSADPTIVAPYRDDSHLVMVGAGQTWVTAHLFLDDQLLAWESLQLTVHGSPFASLQVTPALSVAPEVGSQIAFSADGLSCVGSTCALHPLGPVVSWSSSNPTVASVTEDGIVTIHAQGIAVIQATLGDAQGVAVITPG